MADKRFDAASNALQALADAAELLIELIGRERINDVIELEWVD